MEGFITASIAKVSPLLKDLNPKKFSKAGRKPKERQKCQKAPSKLC